MGAIVFFRLFVFPEHICHMVQIAFAVTMAIWATLFNSFWKRYEARLRQLWGMENYVAPEHTRNAYKPELEDSWRVTLAHVFGDLLAFTMLGLVVTGIYLIETWKASV